MIQTHRPLLVSALALAVGPVGIVRAQDRPSDLRAHVHTLADSLVGGASGLSIDQMGVLYAGTFDDRVYRIRTDGRPEVFATGLYGATGNVVGPLGNLYQLNFYGGYITKIDRHANQTTLATGLTTPVAIAWADGDLYVTNCGTNAISRVSLDGEVTSILQGPPLNCPNGIAYATDGNLYVTNFSDAALLRVTLDGEVTAFATMPHNQNYLASARGHLYVASGGGRQLHRVSLTTGEVSHIAGSGERGSDDGDPLEATFNYPNGIAANGEGMVFIHDLGPRQVPDGIRVPLRAGTVRVVSLPSLTDQLSDLYVSDGPDAMVAAYRRYRSDPATAGLLDEAEVNGWGYATLQGLPEAGLRIFQLNVEAYPDSWRAHSALGDAYAQVGQTADAIAALERSLELNPDNADVADKIRQLRGRS